MSGPAMPLVADEVRRIIREEARNASPPLEKFVVRRVNPLKLESFTSDRILEEGEDDFFVSKGARKKLKAGDVAYVATEADGDYVMLASGLADGSSVAEESAEEGGGSDVNYVHEQAVAAKEWTIPHGLGKVPSVIAFDTLDNDLYFQIVPVSDDELILRFNIDISGRAVLN